MAKIKARFRRRNGIPYAIETFSGTQYRCRHCNEVFTRKKEIDMHLQHVARLSDGKPTQPDHHVPQLDSNVSVSVIYVYDVADQLKKQWLKLKTTDSYDGM
jgi:hypothetical protein